MVGSTELYFLLEGAHFAADRLLLQIFTHSSMMLFIILYFCKQIIFIKYSNYYPKKNLHDENMEKIKQIM